MTNHKPGFLVRITCCMECPYKAYGLRKCGEADRWFDYDVDSDTEIQKWCPKMKVRK